LVVNVEGVVAISLDRQVLKNVEEGDGDGEGEGES
jgi:hypothetical protein